MKKNLLFTTPAQIWVGRVVVKIGPSGGGGKKKKKPPSNLKGVYVSGTTNKKRKKKTKAELEHEEFLKKQKDQERERRKKAKEEDAKTVANVKTQDILLSTILDAASQVKVLEILYKDANGKRSRRRLEPYSLKYGSSGLVLMGHCLTRKQIRSFYLKRISEAYVLNLSFAPQYPITVAKDFEAFSRSTRK